MSHIRWFKDLTIKDIPLVGGKNASLGEMYSKLAKKGVPVPNGFALTAEAYRTFLKANQLDAKIKKILLGLDVKNVRALAKAGGAVRALILNSEFPATIKKEIVEAYRELSKQTSDFRSRTSDTTEDRRPKTEVDVAVRSSATAEDLPDASFAGQQESYLNVRGEPELLVAVKKCISSLFTDRAISYREAKGFDHLSIALSVGVQQMVRSDLAESGVMFTLDTESGFKGVVLINASYGLGEYVVKGQVTPDQFYVFKEGVRQGYPAIINRRLGSKDVKLCYGSGGHGTKQKRVRGANRRRYCLKDAEVIQLAKWGLIIEEHYGRPMDIEWAKDGQTGQLYIVQARSETVKSQGDGLTIETYHLKHRSKILVEGVSVGQRIGQGKVHIIESPKNLKQFKPGEVLVTRITDPDWEPIMRLASAIVTEQGGKTSHAAIVSRELGLPCIVGASGARKILKPGKAVTVSCAEGEIGRVYQGLLPFEVEHAVLGEIVPLRTKIQMNVGDPHQAFSFAHLPHEGVGLARGEFIYTKFIKAHPLAFVHYNKLDVETKKKIQALTIGYKDKTQFLVDKLAEGFASLATAFYPHEVVLRLTDFKSNEYATLIGGKFFEPKEENPMLGWRGAARYYDKKYLPAFKLECAAIKKAREEWGLKNIVVMVPFCRTPEEGKKVLAIMKQCGLERGKDGLKVYVMCEIPANVLSAQEFSEIFDGFSIGSNDLTQLTLGVDRDSALVSHVFNENDAAVKKLIREVIKVAHANGKHVGICGQAPSDIPGFAEFLVQEGIDAISLTPDTVVKVRRRVAEIEKKLGRKPHRELEKLGNQLPATSGPRALQKIVSRAVTTLGALALAVMLLGVTCQTTPQTSAEDAKATIALEVAKAKAEARREFEEEKAKETREYSEDSFVKFTLQFPAGWRVKHQEKLIRFESPDGQEYFVIAELPKKLFAEGGGHTVIISTWNNFEVAHLEGTSMGSLGYRSLRVYPHGLKKSRIMIELSGSPANRIQTILDSIKNFEIKK